MDEIRETEVPVAGTSIIGLQGQSGIIQVDYYDNELMNDSVDLMKYCAQGRLDCVVKIIKSKKSSSDVRKFLNNNRYGWNRSNALMIAVSANQPQICEYLLQCGACCHQVNHQGFNSLMLAAKKGFSVILKQLNSHNHTCDEHCNYKTISPLPPNEDKTWRDERNNLSIFKSSNRYGNNCFMIAASEGHKNICQYIAGIYPENDFADWLKIENKFGKNALQIAAEFGKHEVVEYLLTLGGPSKILDVHFKDSKGRTPLHMACTGSTNAHFKVAKVLIKHGADVSAKTG
jgi:ankyrin repeat protein